MQVVTLVTNLECDERRRAPAPFGVPRNLGRAGMFLGRTVTATPDTAAPTDAALCSDVATANSWARGGGATDVEATSAPAKRTAIGSLCPHILATPGTSWVARWA